MNRPRARLAPALLLSLLVHALLLCLSFGGQGWGLPGFGFPWQERRADATALRVVLAPVPVGEVVLLVEPSRAPQPAMAAPLDIGKPNRSPPASLDAVAVPAERAEAEPVETHHATLAPPPEAAKLLPTPGSESPPVTSSLAESSEVPANAEQSADAAAPLSPLKPAVVAVERVPEPQWVVAPPTAAASEPVMSVAASASAPDIAASAAMAAADAAREQAVAHAAEDALRLAEQRAQARRETDRLEAQRVEAERLEAERQQLAKQEAARQEAVRAEVQRIEAARLEAERQQLAKQEAARQEAARAEVQRIEAARLEAERQQLVKQEAVRQEAARVEAQRAEAARLEAERQQLAKQEAVRQEAARVEAQRAEAARLEAERQQLAKQEAVRQEAARVEAQRAEAARLEAERQQLARQEAARQEAVRAEAQRVESARLADDARREAARRAMGRQLDEEAARRDAAAAAASLSHRLNPSSSGVRRGRLFGRTDANTELVLYAEAWARKIELNMTMDRIREAAKRPHANPLVTVAVRSDGSVESVTFVLSSGVPELDEAIRRIIESLLPFTPFSPALAQEYDVIEIRRTWVVDSAVRLY